MIEIEGSNAFSANPIASLPGAQDRSTLAVLPHEGTFSIMYGSQAVAVGTGHRPGYLARPDEAGQFPVVLVVPGLSGLASSEKAIARKFARNGIAALVVEIFPGTDEEERLASYNQASDRDALLVLQEAAEYLQSDEIFWARTERFGLLGLDVGGRLALAQAASQRWVGAVAIASTPLTGDENRELQVAKYLGSLPVAVLGLYGEADPLIANETVDEAQSRNEHGQWLLYQDAGHFFWNEESDDFDPSAALDFENRTIAFFKATLPEAIVEDLG